ncbi:MAG: SRPBCC family protein [Myxococcaceae bacterium]|jgi:hypothetical protein|nr:SRPBCC family protein [Myxococcaceae bacterium]MCA3012844.1 SRPBCC family protein [Myxococcaceae bacterium]
MTWTTTAMARTKASPEQIWKLWESVADWSRWDESVESSRLDGAFVQGARGSLKPRGGPRATFALVSVEPRVAFTSRSSLPLTTLDIVHTLRVEGSETVIEHRVEMKGVLTFLFRRLIGESIARGLPMVVERLAQLAAGAPS